MRAGSKCYEVCLSHSVCVCECLHIFLCPSLLISSPNLTPRHRALSFAGWQGFTFSFSSRLPHIPTHPGLGAVFPAFKISFPGLLLSRSSPVPNGKDKWRSTKGMQKVLGLSEARKCTPVLLPRDRGWMADTDSSQRQCVTPRWGFVCADGWITNHNCWVAPVCAEIVTPMPMTLTNGLGYVSTATVANPARCANESSEDELNFDALHEEAETTPSPTPANCYRRELWISRYSSTATMTVH